MDAFYASVEQRDRPELRGKPVVIGGTPDGRGVVATCSYEARKFGIHSAMPASQALRLCPHAVFLPSDMAKYKEASRLIRAVFYEVTDLVEPLSLDEAYLDVTENHLDMPLARDVAKYVKRRIFEETQLTASAGVASIKFIAKVASDMQKPDGLTIIPPDRMQAFIDQLPVKKIWGVGPATQKRLSRLGIRTGLELRKTPLARLEQHLGKMGRFLHGLAHGNDPRVVSPNRIAKSRGAERTFSTDVTDVDHLMECIDDQARRVGGSLARMERRGRTITLKIRYDDFTTLTRSRTLADRTDDPTIIATVAHQLLHSATEAGIRPVRLIGVNVSGLDTPSEVPEQLCLDLDGA